VPGTYEIAFYYYRIPHLHASFSVRARPCARPAQVGDALSYQGLQALSAADFQQRIGTAVAEVRAGETDGNLPRASRAASKLATPAAGISPELRDGGTDGRSLAEQPEDGKSMKVKSGNKKARRRGPVLATPAAVAVVLLQYPADWQRMANKAAAHWAIVLNALHESHARNSASAEALPAAVAFLDRMLKPKAALAVEY
jgi:hypothetical protein